MEKRLERIMKRGNESASTLTDEEIFYILNYAARKEASVRGIQLTDKLFGGYEDIAQNIYTYLLAKDYRGKQGIRWLQNNLTIAHLKNSLFFFVRNEYNGMLRRRRNTDYIFNTVSLDAKCEQLDNDKLSIIDIIEGAIDNTFDNDEVESRLDINNIVQSLSDTPIETYTLKYRNHSTALSPKKLIMLMMEFFKDTRITVTGLKDASLIYNNDELAQEEDLKKIVRIIKLDMKRPIISNKIKCLKEGI